MSNGNPRVIVRMTRATIDTIEALMRRRASRDKMKQATISEFVRQACTEKIRSMMRKKNGKGCTADNCQHCGVICAVENELHYRKNLLGEIEILCVDCARRA